MFTVGATQPSNELTAEHTTENLDRQEESGARLDPLRVVGRRPPGRNDAVNMRMWFERLAPGVKNGQESNLRTEVLSIGCNLEKSLGASVEQQGEQYPFVLPDQRNERVWEGEDEMEVANRQQFILTLCHPLIASVGLALGAVPITARVIGDGLVSALRTLIAMTTERCRATASDGVEDLALRPGQRRSIVFAKSVTRVVNHIGHLEGWPTHRFCSGKLFATVI